MSVRISKDGMSGKEYKCAHPWPNNCSIQHGEKGMVFKKAGGGYVTPFFEAFPDKTVTASYIRGEGETILEAENDAFSKFSAMVDCKQHEYERFRDSERGKCIHCNSAKDLVFPPMEKHKCSICDKPSVNFRVSNIEINDVEDDDDIESFLSGKSEEDFIYCYQHYKEKTFLEVEKLEPLRNFYIENDKLFYSVPRLLKDYFIIKQYESEFLKEEDYLTKRAMKPLEDRLDASLNGFTQYIHYALQDMTVFKEAPEHMSNILFTKNEIKTSILLTIYFNGNMEHLSTILEDEPTIDKSIYMNIMTRCVNHFKVSIAKEVQLDKERDEAFRLANERIVAEKAAKSTT